MDYAIGRRPSFICRRWGTLTRRWFGQANLATKVPQIHDQLGTALQEFDAALPNLETMRNVAEHIDEYAFGEGQDSSICRKSLVVASLNGEMWKWLDFEIDVGKALGDDGELELHRARKWVLFIKSPLAIHA